MLYFNYFTRTIITLGALPWWKSLMYVNTELTHKTNQNRAHRNTEAAILRYSVIIKLPVDIQRENMTKTWRFHELIFLNWIINIVFYKYFEPSLTKKREIATLVDWAKRSIFTNNPLKTWHGYNICFYSFLMTGVRVTWSQTFPVRK